MSELAGLVEDERRNQRVVVKTIRIKISHSKVMMPPLQKEELKKKSDGVWLKLNPRS